MKKNADKGYEKTKPKQTQYKTNTNPIKANFRKAKMNVNLYVIKEYENETAFRLEQNKPNTNPTCRGVAPAASPPRRGEAGSNPIYVELTKTSKCANSMFFNIIKEQSEEKDAFVE